MPFVMAHLWFPVTVAFYIVVCRASGEAENPECQGGPVCDTNERPTDDEDPSLLQAIVGRSPASGGWPSRPPKVAKNSPSPASGWPTWPSKAARNDRSPASGRPSWPPKVAEHYIQLDGFTKTPVPREEMRGFVRELLIKFPVQDNSIKVSGKTAFIPFASILEGEYSRNAYSQDHQDYGVEKALAFSGLGESMLSDRVKLGFAEKSHTLYFPAEVAHATKDRLEAERAAQSASAKAKAIAMRQEKLTSIMGVASSFGTQVIASGKDLAHEDALRKFVSDEHGVTPAVWAAIRRTESELQSRKSKTTATKPIRSSIGCLHLEDEGAMNFTGDGVWVPLERKYVVYRGRLAQYPNEEYQMSTGFAVFYHNQTSNTLDIYLGFSSIIDLLDSNQGFVSKFSVGPPDGHSLPIAPEGRETSTIPPWMQPAIESAGKAAQIMSKMIPTDFTLLHSDRQQVGCSDSMVSELRQNSRELHRLLHMFMIRIKGLRPTDLLQAIPDMANAYTAALTWSLCAVDYLRPVYNDSAVAMGRIAIMGFMHVLGELHPDDVALMVANHSQWNTIHGVEAKDS